MDEVVVKNVYPLDVDECDNCKEGLDHLMLIAKQDTENGDYFLSEVLCLMCFNHRKNN